ncbi:hypothetical protein [Aeoliella mucimassa]|uniref:Uncharacterized protein n=1 Tax=Aeoliella mucimassa TaxID=2527972 RepID=A0A518AKM8_9BACT|nr:hypothetical protein [Aeoliella mucimassa]QDU55234.1 hypothetical protein Pan181_14200 [Aeoliella mucimassa]
MDRSPIMRHTCSWLSLVLLVATTVTSSGCHTILATGVYLLQGGNVVPAQCEALEEQRVVVACRCPSASEYSIAGAPDQIARSVTNLLRENVPKVDVVDYREVDKWHDENDWGDFEGMGRAVKADRLVVIDLAHLDLYKGQTLYQGNADVTVTVYDLTGTKSKIVWEHALGEVLFPRNSAIPVQDKSPKQFQREYTEILARQIAVYFYKHDPNADFALDAIANQ